MSELISCRHCDSPTCRGCNIYTLANALTIGRFDKLMDAHHAVRINTDVVELKKGKWVEERIESREGYHSKIILYCSICWWVSPSGQKFTYCPICGTRMMPDD